MTTTASRRFDQLLHLDQELLMSYIKKLTDEQLRRVLIGGWGAREDRGPALDELLRRKEAEVIARLTQTNQPPKTPDKP